MYADQTTAHHKTMRNVTHHLSGKLLMATEGGTTLHFPQLVLSHCTHCFSRLALFGPAFRPDVELRPGLRPRRAGVLALATSSGTSQLLRAVS